jgi:hypothetical protein
VISVADACALIKWVVWKIFQKDAEPGRSLFAMLRPIKPAVFYIARQSVDKNRAFKAKPTPRAVVL